LEDSFASSSVNDVSQESNGSEEQDVKMSVAVSEDEPTPVFEDSVAYDSVNDVSQESNGSEEQDVKMSVAVSEDKPAPAKRKVKSSKLNRKLKDFVPSEPSVSNHL